MVLGHVMIFFFNIFFFSLSFSPFSPSLVSHPIELVFTENPAHHSSVRFDIVRAPTYYTERRMIKREVRMVDDLAVLADGERWVGANFQILQKKC
jgi:hypothetical protein